MADVESAIALIEELAEWKEKLRGRTDQGARNEAIQLCKRLVLSLTHPTNTAVDLAFSPFLTVAARIAVDLGLFSCMVKHGSPVSSSDLASQTSGEELLIIRILRPLSSAGFVSEVGERKWAANPITHAMATKEIAAGHRMIGEMIVGAAQKAPKYFREYGHHCPTDPRDGLMQFAFQTKMTTFELFNTIPQVLKDFNLFMGNTMGARNYWVDWYPVREQLLEGLQVGSDLLVDIGAGKGHDLKAFHAKYPHEGGLILQDLAVITDNLVDIDPAIRIMAHDFFTKQPVKGARAYFYHHILHDWSDEKCLEILECVKQSMEPGYSKLLIHEMLVPEMGASTFHAMLDMTMMAFNAGMERTERQWRELLDEAGFEVLKVWAPMQEDADGIIEAIIAA